MNKKFKFTSAVLSAGLLITPVSGLVNQYDNVAKANNINTNINQNQEKNINIKKLDKYVKFNKEKKIFEFERNKDLSSEEINFLEKQISETNQKINNLTIGENEQVKYLSNKVKVISTPKLENGTSLRYAEGIDAIDFYWWGMDIWLSRTTINRSLSTGALVAGVLIPAGKIVAALIILTGTAGIWNAVPGGIYMKVYYPFNISEVRWHG